MKAFTTVSLLLAGLIVTCTAGTIGQPGSSSSEESSETKELMQQFETECYKKTGSNQTFKAIGASFAAIPVCFLTQMNGIGFMIELERLQVNASTRHQFFAKYCPQIRSALPCLEAPIKELSKCLDEDDALILHGMYNATPVALDMICENDGAMLLDEGANLDVCIANYSNYTDECAGLVSKSTDMMAVSKYGEAQCQELTQVRDCMEKKLDECNGPKLMALFDVFWHEVLKNSPCGNFITGPNEIEDDKA